jgi:hypothetical protein
MVQLLFKGTFWLGAATLAYVYLLYPVLIGALAGVDHGTSSPQVVPGHTAIIWLFGEWDALDGGALDGGALDGGALDGGALDGGFVI